MASTTLPQLSKQFFQANEEIRQKCQAAVRTVAHEVYNHIVNNTPIWTGSYMLSHRVGINQKSSEPPTYVNQEEGFLGLAPGQADEYRSRAYSRILDLSIQDNIQFVYISNDIGHAADVEYIGWANTPAYHVYGKAYLRAKLIFTSTKSDIEFFGFGSFPGNVRTRLGKMASTLKSRGEHFLTKGYKGYFEHLSTGQNFKRWESDKLGINITELGYFPSEQV